MQQEFFKGHNAVRMTINATLYSNKHHKIIASKDFTEVIPVLHPDPYSGVLAMNRAESILLEKIAKYTVMKSFRS